MTDDMQIDIVTVDFQSIQVTFIILIDVPPVKTLTNSE